MATDPLEQMQEFLQAQQRLWEHLSEQNKQQDWSSLFPPDSEIGKTAKNLNEQAQAYGEFAKSLVEQLQQQNADQDPIQIFLDQFQAYREKLLFQELSIPPGFAELYKYMGMDNAMAGIPFMQGQWNYQLERIKKRFTDAEQTLSAFQQAYVRFQQLEQQLNRQVYEAVRSTLEETTEPENLRAYVDLWVETYEYRYQLHIQTPDYQHAYQALILSSARLQQQLQQNWDEEYRLFGLVPVEDYDQLLERHHQLQKQVRSQQKQLDILSEQLQTLQADLPMPKQSKGSKAKPATGGDSAS